MDNESLIKLTNNLYRLTLLFPKKEPLRYKMREAATNILAKPSEGEFELLSRYFEIAQNQNWVSPSDLFLIKEEYDKLRECFQSTFGQEEQIIQANIAAESASVPDEKEKVLSGRHERILDLLKKKGRIQVWQVAEALPEVTKRTLRRDFEQMVGRGLIERIGERNDTYYRIKVGEI